MGTIRIYKDTELESIRLRTFADICNRKFRQNGLPMWVTLEEIYFDFGQNWMYTAPITYDRRKDKESSWQSLCPRDYEIITDCDSIGDMNRYADYYVNAVIDGDICVDISKIK